MVRLFLACLAVAMLPVVLAACEPEADVEPGTCLGDGEPAIDVGHLSLTEEFVPIEDGDSLDVRPSPGGSLELVTVSLWLDGFGYPGEPFVWSEDSELRQGEVDLALLHDGEQVGAYRGVVFDPEEEHEEPVLVFNLNLVLSHDLDVPAGTSVELVARVVDACAGELAASRSVRLEW